MTRLTAEKALKRETHATDRRRPIVVSLFPFYLSIGVKRTREFYMLPWDHILDHARMIDARQKLAAKGKSA